MNRSVLIRLAGLSALVAGVLFVAIQPLHPSDTLASVATDTWTIVHYLTLAMTVLFLVGITGIYIRQVDETAWLGFLGITTLATGLLITAGFVFLEAFVSPLLVDDAPEFVGGLLHLVGGSDTQVDLGGLQPMWAVSGVLFPLGCLLFGTALLRARILPRGASALFAFGLPVAVVVVSFLPFDLHRVGAMPVGVGLAWLGYTLWSDQGPRSTQVTEALKQ